MSRTPFGFLPIALAIAAVIGGEISTGSAQTGSAQPVIAPGGNPPSDIPLTTSGCSGRNCRLRGTIVEVAGNVLSVRTRDGASVTIKLTDNATVTGVTKASLADIKQNSYVGITAMPRPDGAQTAMEVHIFPEARRGAGEGHRPWDLGPQSTMTNANVEQLVSGVDGPVLTMKYKDGEKKIVVPNNIPIVKFVTGDRGELKPGAHIFVGAGTLQPDGSIAATGVNVGRDGIAPPM
jgi:hypothetical protein